MLIRKLWTEERVDFAGDYYRTTKATIYDRPEVPIPIYIAASGPLAAKLAGRVGDGFVCTSGKDQDPMRTCSRACAKARRRQTATQTAFAA